MKDIQRSQLRLPTDLHEQLKRYAEVAGRSLNAEIVFRLAQSFDTSEGSSSESEFSALAAKLADPKHRSELEGLLSILARLGVSNGFGK